MQYGVNAATCIDLHPQESVYIPGIEDQWLLANCIRTAAQCESHMRVMQVIRRTDGKNLDRVATNTAHSINVTIEALEFGEKMCIREIAIENAGGITWIHGRDKPVSSVPDGLHVTRRDIPGGANQSKILHVDQYLQSPNLESKRPQSLQRERSLDVNKHSAGHELGLKCLGR